jgi:hypothetical protein
MLLLLLLLWQLLLLGQLLLRRQLLLRILSALVGGGQLSSAGGVEDVFSHLKFCSSSSDKVFFPTERNIITAD